MDWILYLLLALAAAGDILLAVVLAKVMRKNAGPEQKIDTADDFVRASLLFVICALYTPCLRLSPQNQPCSA